MNVSRLLDHLVSDRDYRGQVVHIETLPQREARTRSPHEPIHPSVEQALRAMGISALYTHQADAIDAVRRKQNVVVVTGTASGKSLCYHIPVLETLIERPGATALYMFPTKALAQDQLKGLLRFKEIVPSLALVAGTYDGDTPPNTRRTLRDEGNAILTNPDMLHSGIMPRHTSWARFFESLQYVVIDEVHTYRGIFGSHVANVLRRLQRITRFYGSDPTYILCSATIRNPLEHAQTLTGLPCTLIDDDGAPRGKKHVVFWNPPRIGETSERRSTNGEARNLMVELLANRMQTITFARSRIVAELLYRYVREDLEHRQPTLARKIRAYRGGYLPAERREIEQQLFSGELMGITSTNALELGIDIGSLDAVIVVGYPGSISSTWQQIGRAGRKHDESIAFLVAQNAPLDQYLMQHPEYFFEQNPESAIIDPDNPHIVLGHLRATMFELPLHVNEERIFGPKAPALIDLLDEDRQIIRRADLWYWTGKGYPADDFSLRNSTDLTYTIVDTTSGKNQVIGSTDELSAFMQLHTEAVYLHHGEPYFVSELNLDERIAYVHRADPDYYTQSITDQRIRVIDEQMNHDWRGSKVSFGDVSVTFITFMYKKIKFYDRDSIGFGPVDLPPLPLDTCAMWIVPKLRSLKAVREAGRSPAEAMLAIANVVTDVISLFAMCDSNDIGSVIDSSNTGVPTLFIYDRYPGGAGFAQNAYELIEDIMDASCRLILSCDCLDGCPSCVGSPIPPYVQGDLDGSPQGLVPDKEGALVILHDLLDRPAYVPTRPRVHGTVGTVMGPEDAAPGQSEAASIKRPPSDPLPEQLELRLRRRLQSFKDRGEARAR